MMKPSNDNLDQDNNELRGSTRPMKNSQIRVKLDFYLRFYTHPGQSIFVTGNLAELGDGNVSTAIPLNYVNGEFWHCSLVLSGPLTAPVHYHYILKGADGHLTEEWGDDKFIEAPGEGIEELHLIDTWNYSGEFENVFFTQPF